APAPAPRRGRGRGLAGTRRLRRGPRRAPHPLPRPAAGPDPLRIRPAGGPAAASRRAILSRAQLMDRAWDSAAASGDRTVDTHVKTLRAKLRAAGVEPDPIRTHRGLGYAIEA